MIKYGLLLAATAGAGATFVLSSTPASAGVVCQTVGDENGSGSTTTGGVGGALACGGSVKATGDESIGIGESVTVDGANSIVIGTGTNTSANHIIVIDTSAAGESVRATSATGDFAVALGDGVQLDSDHSVAIGDDIVSNSSHTVALGSGLQVVNGGSIAIGSNTVADGNGTVAIGKNAAATGTNSVALGDGSVADQANTVSVGSAGNERRVTNVAAGVNDTDAVNVGQLNAAIAAAIPDNSAAVDALQDQLDGLQGTVNGLQDQVNGLFDLRRRDRVEARRGTAAAVAMSEAPMPSRDGGVSYSLHGASYRGQYAIGGSMKYRINRSAAIDFGLSSAGHRDTAVRLGVSGEF